MIVDLPDETGASVISIDVYREARAGRLFKKQCGHRRVTVSRSLNALKCRDCNEYLNAVEWIIELADDWEHYRRLISDYTKAKEEYDKRTRVKCRHCGQFTPVYL